MSDPQEAATPPRRLDPAFKADLIDFARERIQMVWNDVPGGVDAATLASNVVAAQEFLWLSLQFPVEAATPSNPHSAEALDLDAIEKRAGAATGTRYGMSATDATGTILWATADDQPFVHLGEIFPETSQGDIDFLLHARTDVPTLVAVVRLRDAEVAELRAERDGLLRLREVAHWECDCVPDLGPTHCHACSDAAGHPVEWADSTHGPSAEVAELKAKIAGLEVWPAHDHVWDFNGRCLGCASWEKCPEFGSASSPVEGGN